MRRAAAVLIATVVAALCASAPCAALQDQSDVELSADLVTVTTVVRDQSGAFVTDLEAKDFTLYEDGVAQPIDQVYRQQELPLRLALLFDASLSVRNRLDFERRAAGRFFESVLRPNDQAALFAITTEWRRVQPLTSSVPTLVDALGTIEAEGITSLFGAVDGASTYLGQADGRRVAVVLSDGYDTAEQSTLAQALETAQRNDVVIYGISPSGESDDPSPATRIGRASLTRLCDETGGVAFFPAVEHDKAREGSDLDAIYRRVADEIRAQYVLTYYSNAPSHDGRFHTLRVEPKRPGLTVTARKGYFAK